MKMKGIYYNPRKKMMTMRMMIKAVVRKVKGRKAKIIVKLKMSRPANL